MKLARVIMLCLTTLSLYLPKAHGMSEFSHVVEKKCDNHLKKYDFAQLRNILYQYSGSQACVEWMDQAANKGHGPILYMLVRDSYYRTGAGQLEIVGESLTTTLERIMKFIIRLEQDIACWEETLGHSIDPSILINFKKKINSWFSKTIRGNRLEEFHQALQNTKDWFAQFSDYSPKADSDDDLFQTFNNSNCSRYQQIESPFVNCAPPLGYYDRKSLVLPSPLWIKLITWGSFINLDPNTITYQPVDAKLKEICSKQATQKEFETIREKILQNKIQELENTASAQAFIAQLNIDTQQNNNALTTYVPAIAKFAGKAALSYFLGTPP